MRPTYEVHEAHYDSVTAYRVVSVTPDTNELSTVHIYENEFDAHIMAGILNKHANKKRKQADRADKHNAYTQPLQHRRNDVD